MPRNFVVASSEHITLGLGAGASVNGAFTIAAIVRTSSDGGGVGKGILSIGSVNATLRSMGLLSSDAVSVRSNNANQNSTTTVKTADGFCYVAVDKAAGTATPRFHIQKYAAATAMVHENAGGTLGDSTPATSSLIARNQAAGTAYFPGDIAICGAWASQLTDAQHERMAYDLNAWFQIQPNGLWLLDQADVAMTVQDRTGNGANQTAITGTTVGTVSVPVFSYGARVRIVDTVATAQSATLTPVEIAVTPVVLARTATVTRTLSPVTVTVTPVALTGASITTRALSPVTITVTPVLLTSTATASAALSPVAICVSPHGDCALTDDDGRELTDEEGRVIVGSDECNALTAVPQPVSVTLTPALITLTAVILTLVGPPPPPRDVDWDVGQPVPKWTGSTGFSGWEGDEAIHPWEARAAHTGIAPGRPEV